MAPPAQSFPAMQHEVETRAKVVRLDADGDTAGADPGTQSRSNVECVAPGRAAAVALGEPPELFPEADFPSRDDELAQVRDLVSRDQPDEMMRERELNAALERAVAGLPDEQRLIFTLRFIDGRSNDEVSAALGTPVTTLKAKAKRVRLKVRREIFNLLDASC